MWRSKLSVRERPNRDRWGCRYLSFRLCCLNFQDILNAKVRESRYTNAFVPFSSSGIMAALSFLDLPRELRGVIYSYTHHEVAFPNYILPYAEGSQDRGLLADLLFHRVPLLSLLLVNSQTYAEYRESLCSTAVVASIDLKSGRSTISHANSEVGPVEARQVDRLLHRVRHVTFTDVGHSEYLDRTSHLSLGIGILEQCLKAKSLQLDTARVVLQKSNNLPTPHTALETTLRDIAVQCKRHYKPLESFLGLTCRRSHHGLLTGFAYCRPPMRPNVGNVYLHGQEQEIIHRVSELAIYTFEAGTTVGTGDAEFLPLLGMWKVQKYPDDLRDILSDEQKADIVRWSKVDLE
jgi:hypothetical protein